MMDSDTILTIVRSYFSNRNTAFDRDSLQTAFEFISNVLADERNEQLVKDLAWDVLLEYLKTLPGGSIFVRYLNLRTKR